MFGKPKLIIYIRRTALELYSEKSSSYLEKLQFLPQHVLDEEILDHEGFVKFLADFFVKVIEPDSKVAILLSDEVTSSKIIQLGSVSRQDLDAQKQHFFDDVPFGQHELSKQEISFKGNLFLIGCNRRLFWRSNARGCRFYRSR